MYRQLDAARTRRLLQRLKLAGRGRVDVGEGRNVASARHNFDEDLLALAV